MRKQSATINNRIKLGDSSQRQEQENATCLILLTSYRETGEYANDIRKGRKREKKKREGERTSTRKIKIRIAPM